MGIAHPRCFCLRNGENARRLLVGLKPQSQLPGLVGHGHGFAAAIAGDCCDRDGGGSLASRVMTCMLPSSARSRLDSA